MPVEMNLSTGDRSMADSTSVSELVQRWARERKQGLAVTVEELCAATPELLGEVRERIEALRSMERLLGLSAEIPKTAGPDSIPASDQATDSWATMAAATSATSARTPVQVPGYEVLGELGRGGMGVVYKAVQRSLKRTVALKMILVGGHASDEEIARFRLEAETLAKLQHPNIVQIFEIGAQDDRPFFALEFVPDGNLDRRLRGTPQAARQAAEFVAVLARAVHAAHQAGVIHRDLKPANILLQRKSGIQNPTSKEGSSDVEFRISDFSPKVTDFGLAKQLDTVQELSRPDAIMGTPSYMAPEQAWGRVKDIGPAADVYALAAILYELLVGRPPFKAENPWATVIQVRTQEPLPPSTLQTDLPRDLETISLMGLRKEPGQRYGTALELADDLERFLAGQPVHARPVPAWERGWKWVRRRPALAAAAGFLILAVLAGVTGAVFFGLYKEQQAANLSRTLETREQLSHLVSTARDAEVKGDDHAALEAWTQASALAAGDPETAGVELAGSIQKGKQRVQERLDQAAERARRENEKAVARKAFTAHREQFIRHRDEVRLHAVSYRKEDILADLAYLRLEAPAALTQLGLDSSRSADFGNGLERYRELVDTPAELAHLADECYQVLLAWSGVEQEVDPRQALSLLDNAAALAAAHSLATPRTYYLHRARCLDRLGDPAGAAAAQQLAASVKQANVLDLFEDALAAYQLGKIDQAVLACQRVFSMDANHFWAQYLLALCNLRDKRWAEAAIRLDNCLQKRPDDPWLVMHRAVAGVELKNYSDAEAKFASALARVHDPGFQAVVLSNRSVLHLRQKHWDDAERDLREAIKRQPAAYQGYVTLARLYKEQRKYAEAVQTMDAAIKCRPDDPGLYYIRAWYQEDRGDWAAARRDFEACLQREPKGSRSDHWAESKVALAHLKQKHGRGEVQAALADSDEVVNARPDFPAGYRQRFQALEEMGRHAEAGEALDSYLALEKNPPARVYHARGLIHMQLKEHHQAVQSFTRVLLLAKDAETMTARGWAYLALDSPRPALLDFEAALLLKPADTDALCGRAVARVQTGLVENATADAEAALQQQPPSGRLLFQAACVFARAGQTLAERQAGHTPDRLGPVERAQALAAEREIARHQSRALELLREAVLAQKPAERGTFWRDTVLKTPALAPLRRTSAMNDLDRQFRPS
jgi:tetratricopeptide (TPR) repeat protein